VGAPHQTKVQHAYAFFVGIVAKEVQAHPLYRMKKKKGQPEKYQEDDCERIRQDLLHTGTKIKNRLGEAVFIS
jgi:hypothetical protein